MTTYKIADCVETPSFRNINRAFSYLEKKIPGICFDTTPSGSVLVYKKHKIIGVIFSITKY